jgi:Transcription factor WhiB
MTNLEHVTLGLSGVVGGGTDWPFDGSQLCKTVDPELFFPEKGKTAVKTIAKAKAICSECKFNAACLAYALKYSALEGIWAGTSTKERTLIRRRNRKLLIK